MSKKSKLGRPTSKKVKDALCGIPATKVAEAAGFTKQTVYNWVHGTNGGAPMAGPLIKIAIEKLKNKIEEDESSNGSEQQIESKANIPG